MANAGKKIPVSGKKSGDRKGSKAEPKGRGLSTDATNPLNIPKKRGPHGPRQPRATFHTAPIHVGELIGKRLKEQGISMNKLAGMLKLTPPTVSLMVAGNSLQTERLIEVSYILKHDFFSEISHMLQLETKNYGVSLPKRDLKGGRNASKGSEYEIQFLREENEYLKRIVELMAGAGSFKTKLKDISN
jgi:plasmid maintenance system antidote protein VapI